MKAREWPPETLEQLREMTLLGYTIRRMAAALGTSKEIVSRARRRYGLVPLRPPPEPELEPAIAPLDFDMPSRGQCQFIHDNGPWRRRSPLWCKKPVYPGSAYCPEHHMRCYTTR